MNDHLEVVFRSRGILTQLDEVGVAAESRWEFPVHRVEVTQVSGQSAERLGAGGDDVADSKVANLSGGQPGAEA